MARGRRPTTGGPGSMGGGRRRGRGADRFRQRKYTRINVEAIDYQDLNLLRRFISTPCSSSACSPEPITP